MARRHLHFTVLALLFAWPCCCSSTGFARRPLALATTVATFERPGYNPDRPGKPMQDRTFVATIEGAEGPPLLCCGVLDGHGRKGHDVASWLQSRLPEELVKCCSSAGSNHGRISTGMVEAFLGAQQAIIKDTTVASRASGTTAVVAILDKQSGRVTVGNVGDSRAVCGAKQGSSSSSSSSWVATALSSDTTTKNMPTELERVLAKGARVDSQGNVFAGPIGIAMTRALGDTVLKSVGVLAEPHFAHDTDSGAQLPLGQPAFLLLASDGVWGVLTDEQAVSIVGAVLDEVEVGAAGGERGRGGEATAHRALETLATAAAEKWQAGLPCEVLVDDISCVLAVLG